MKIYDCKEKPIKVFGIPLLYTSGVYHRLPDDLMVNLPSLNVKGLCPNGGRICFRTNSETFTFRARIKIIDNSVINSLFSATGFVVYVGERHTSQYIGTAHMTYNLEANDNKEEKFIDLARQINMLDNTYYVIEKTFTKSSEMEDVTIFMPGVCLVDCCEVVINDNAKIEEPIPYKYSKPIVFYGSSITSGLAVSRISNNYSSLLSRWLNADYQNYGFAGRAWGESEMADFMASLEMSAFVMDYDHNAPNVDHLRKTHEAFYKRFRSVQPRTPVIMLSRPDFYDYDDSYARREIIRNTYENAKLSGDNNVYFIDGETLLGNDERHACTIDLVHPNDYGHMKMAKTIYPVLRMILDNMK